MWGNPDADITRDIVQLLHERIEQGLLTVFIKIKAHQGDPLNELADWWADGGRQSENIRWSLPTNRPIFSWTENGTSHRSPRNPTAKKRIDLQVARKQPKSHTGSTANFLTREDTSRDLLGKFHKDKSVWIRARRRVLQCISYQFPCDPQLNFGSGVYLKRSNADYAENITRKRKKILQTQSKVWDTYNVIAQLYNSHQWPSTTAYTGN